MSRTRQLSRTRHLSRIATAFLLGGALVLGGCSAEDAFDLRGEQPVPKRLVRMMKARDMAVDAPVLMRIFKEESTLEVWKQKADGRYALLKKYDICKYSGRLGPKLKEGDRQAPEGFYHVDRGLMNPRSSYFLSFNLGYPNRFDRAHARTGKHLMVHGACSSAGCYAMEDDQIAEIYAMARDALGGGQRRFQVQALPFRMTPENMARHRDNPNFGFWENLKVGYDHFELTRTPPAVEVCDRSYRFNEKPLAGSFVANAPCPSTTTPERLAKLYASYQSDYRLRFDKAVRKLGGEPPAPTVEAAGNAAVADVSVPEGVTVEPLAE